MSETPTGALAMGVYVHVAELDKAKAEIKRLRAALEEILSFRRSPGSNVVEIASVRSIASRALKETR